MNGRHLVDPSPYESGTWGTLENPCPSERTLSAHVDGQLDAVRAEAVETHLDRCAVCARVARRVEGLSNLLRTWESRSRVAAPSRLSAAVLRTVAPEAAALRRESVRTSARAFALAAAVVVALGTGVAAALLSPGARTNETARASGTMQSASLVGAVGPSLVFPLDGLRPLAIVESPDSSTPAVIGPPRAFPGTFSPLPDEVATAAFVRYGAYFETQSRVEEDVYVVYDRALPGFAAGPYARVRRLEAWFAERALRASESVTLDPSAMGLSVLDVLPLPSAAELPAFLARLPTFVEPASRHAGGIVVRPLPARAGASASASALEVDDLADAVRARRVVVRPDTNTDPTALTLDIAPTTLPILIPAGELLAGGACDRVVAEGLWLPASSSARTVVLVCLPIAHLTGSPGQTPVPTGLVAGPELRGLLAYRADREGVLALVDGQVGDAALDRGVDGRTSLLALYDAASPEVAAAKARAKEFASRFEEGAAGFVVSDPSGRFEGLEHTILRGAARRALLERLLVGYLIESRTRTSLDAPRSGVDVEVALARLAEGAPRLATTASSTRLRGGLLAAPAGRDAPDSPLSPVRPVGAAPGTVPLLAPIPRRLSGEDPRSGLRLEGVPAEHAKPPLVSGLVPGIR